jgi:dTDP-4-dehydrorhamnose reductase
LKILVVGAGGMLGRDLAEILGSAGEVTAWDLPELDITRAGETREKIVGLGPGIIINCAAFTDVDGCESRPDFAFAVNAEGVRNLALAALPLKAILVHLSTDYVFSGDSSRPYRPDDLPAPRNTYGRSKLQGEVFLRESGADHLLVRTAWLYGPRGRNFVEAILRQAEAGKELRVVDDQKGSPTFTRDLSSAIRDLLAAGVRGVFHLTNSDSCTWHGFALEILRQKRIENVKIRAISSEELGRPARRPAFSVLDCSRYEEACGKKMRPWREGLEEYFSFRENR